MVLDEQVKKGGRYTKREQEERKLQVYHLHFEQNKPAVKIAEQLNVNRNTINDDITYWHKQLASEMNAQDITAKMTKQIQRMEIQRNRLLDDLEDIEDLDNKIKIERFISDIDNRLVQTFSKMIFNGNESLPPTVKLEEIKDEINEDEIKEFTRDLILGDEDPDSNDVYSENELKFGFIRRTKCDITYAYNVIKKMKQDGLDLCDRSDIIRPSDVITSAKDFSKKYDLARFASLRGYLTINELAEITKKRLKIRQEI